MKIPRGCKIPDREIRNRDETTRVTGSTYLEWLEGVLAALEHLTEWLFLALSEIVHGLVHLDRCRQGRRLDDANQMSPQTYSCLEEIRVPLNLLRASSQRVLALIWIQRFDRIRAESFVGHHQQQLILLKHIYLSNTWCVNHTLRFR